MQPRLLIIGAGMAAARLLLELVARDHDYAIEVIGEEPYPSYNRILLSSLLSGREADADLALIETDWYHRHGITIATNERALHIDTAAKRVQTDRRASVPYDRLVIATGSVPYIPTIAGLDTGAVFAFRNQTDLQNIQTAARSGRRAVVIGGGLLGLEAANGLCARGMEVTVVNREPWLMPRQLDEAAAAVLQHTLEQQGMAFRLDVTATAVHSVAGSISAITLTSGETLPADLLLLTAGILPNTGLARDSGIACERGILVDQRLATRSDSVYALGECCQIEQQLFGLVAPVYQQAAVLAAQLTGHADDCYVHRDATTQLKVAGVTVVSGGLLPFPPHCRSQSLVDRRNHIYRRLVFDASRLVGFVLIGNPAHKAWYETLLETHARVAAEDSDLMFTTPTPAAASVATLHAA